MVRSRPGLDARALGRALNIDGPIIFDLLAQGLSAGLVEKRSRHWFPAGS